MNEFSAYGMTSNERAFFDVLTKIERRLDNTMSDKERTFYEILLSIDKKLDRMVYLLEKQGSISPS